LPPSTHHSIICTSQDSCRGQQHLRPSPGGAFAGARFRPRRSGQIIEGDGDSLPVSALPIDGTFPTATAQWEKRNIALEIPVWDENLCIQCGKCVMVCPHAVIRAKIYDPALLEKSPATFKSTAARWKEFRR